MQIVIDKENLIRVISITLYVVSGDKSEYEDAKNATIELLEQVGYTPLVEPKVEEDGKSCWNCKYKLKDFTDNPCYECFRRLTDDGWEEEE